METSVEATPETIYERRWAEAVLEAVLGRLRQEYESGGERERFEILKPFLIAEKQTKAGATAATQLGITESAVYSAVHRLRKRYGEILREEIAHTVGSPGEIEEELRYLVRESDRKPSFFLMELWPCSIDGNWTAHPCPTLVQPVWNSRSPTMVGRHSAHPLWFKPFPIQPIRCILASGTPLTFPPLAPIGRRA